ncbi:hypothetical protein SAMN04490239_0421 [Rhodococcus koreensis]|uniref:Uncharacterized protein n=1 Tax=Rhodococcus koreensis TaxID=99653 RepID=A0A1H4IEN2_9NOCA|nr:hypothetical protein SAMN04490239_0421 [Rhodococcus koreensis]
MSRATDQGYITATRPVKKNGAVPPKQKTVAFPSRNR